MKDLFHKFTGPWRSIGLLILCVAYWVATAVGHYEPNQVTAAIRAVLAVALVVVVAIQIVALIRRRFKKGS